MGSFRSEPQTKKTTIRDSFGKYKFAVSHMCGWRLYMEDAHLSIAPFSNKELGLFAVFDGHGGAEVAVFVERHFPQELEKNQSFQADNYEKGLKETFLKMDELLQSEAGQGEIKQIQKEMRENGNGPNYEEPSHAGCTANVVLITPDYIYCANSGDSRSVASIGKKTHPLSTDHKPEDPKQIKRIQKAGGEVVQGRVQGNLNLSRAIGDLEYKKNAKLAPEEQMITADPEILKVKNEKIDFIIMGCDGIWEVKQNEEMVKWIGQRLKEKEQNGKILEQLLTELVAKEKSVQYGMDNMSSIIITF